jgi:hypothetical protein
VTKLELKYTFEKMFNGKFQVRLYGEFVCFSDSTDENKIDVKLKESGYESRNDFLEHRLSHYN